MGHYLSYRMPYKSMLIYYSVGVGKTCTAITIAETLKHIVKESDGKIYVIRSDEIERQIFDINAIIKGKPLNQCTGDTYLQNPKHAELAQHCSNGNMPSCDQLKFKVEKHLRSIYEFSGARLWAGKILKEIDTKTKNLDDSLKENKIKSIIQKLYNNSVIIVDFPKSCSSANDTRL